MSTSVIVSVLVLVTGFFVASGPRPWSLQPATAQTRNRRGYRKSASKCQVLATAASDDDKNNGPLALALDTLRVLGIVRKRVDRPTVGRKAFVRWWERLRALIALAAIVVGLGIALAAIVGVTVLGLGFLLEQAIG